MCSLACSFCSSVPLTMYTSPPLRINFAPVLVLIKLRLSPPLPMTNPLNALGMSTNSPGGAFSSDFLLCVYARKQDSELFISLVLPAVNEDYKWPVVYRQSFWRLNLATIVLTYWSVLVDGWFLWPKLIILMKHIYIFLLRLLRPHELGPLDGPLYITPLWQIISEPISSVSRSRH